MARGERRSASLPDAGPRRGAGRTRQQRGHLAAASAAVLIAVITVVTQHWAEPTFGDVPRRVKFGDLVVTLPGSWHAVTPAFATATLYAPMGWVTNQDPGPQCTRGGSGDIGCHAPVGRLGAGGVLVSVEQTGGPSPGVLGAPRNSTLGGLPAYRSNGLTGCSFISGAVQRVTILAVSPTSMLRITACFGPSAAEEQREVDHALATVVYKHA